MKMHNSILPYKFQSLGIIQARATAPAVVLLGWYGASDRHLAKYSNILSEHGYPSIRGVMPGSAVFSPVLHPRIRFAKALLQYIEADTAVHTRQLVFYVFSNGGGFPLEQIDKLIHSDPQYKHFASRIAGVIFDSAPCYMHPLAGVTAMGIGRSWPIRLLAVALFGLLMLVMLLLDPLRPWNYWRSMRDLHMAKGTSLYLYSADDPLCDSTKLDELIAQRRCKCGPVVEAKKWQHSKHVGHLRCHTDEYTAVLLQFLQHIEADEQPAVTAKATNNINSR